VLGIVLPLYVLTFPSGTLTPIVARAFLFGALVFLASSFIQFGFDVFQGPKHKDKLYVSDRWYSPMLKLVDQHKPHFDNGGMLDLEYFRDALNSEDRKSFPKKVLAALEDYIQQGMAYNKDAVHFNNSIVGALSSSKFFAPLQAKSKSLEGQGLILYPYSFLFEEPRWQTLLNNLAHGPHNYINVEILMSSWSHVEFVIPRDAFAKDPAHLVKSLESFRLSAKRQ